MGSRQHAVNCLYGKELFSPELKGLSPRSKQAVKEWDKHISPQSPPPVSKEVDHAIVAFHVSQNRPELALAFVDASRLPASIRSSCTSCLRYRFRR